MTNYRLDMSECDHNQPEGYGKTPQTDRKYCLACGQILDESIVTESDKYGETYELEP